MKDRLDDPAITEPDPEPVPLEVLPVLLSR
jgi:hypothetical protein